MEVLTEILNFLIEVLKIISPYIGVLVGVFLGYLLNYRFDKIKRKRSVKSELYQYVNLYYGVYKDHFVAHNYYYLLNRQLKLFNRQSGFIHHSVANNSVRQEIIIEHNHFREKVNANYKNLVEIESKMISCIQEIGDLYGYEIFKSISALINPIIKNSNDFEKIYLSDYSNLNYQQIANSLQNLEKDLKAKMDELSDQVSELNKELYSVLNRKPKFQ